jgi:acetyl esterase
VLDSLFRGLSSAGRLHPRARPSAHRVEVIRDVAYLPTGRPEHRLDIYRPSPESQWADRRPWPVVLYVHGGGFRILSKDTHWLMGLAFARRGAVVFNVSYRLAPRHRFPAAAQDVFAAYRWVLEHAASYGGDLSRLVVSGESAGANLSLGLTLATAEPRPEPWAKEVFDTGRVPDACVAACGIFQVSDTHRFASLAEPPSRFVQDRLIEVTEAYLGDPKASASPSFGLADPLLLVEQAAEQQTAWSRPLPPIMLPVGTADPLMHDTQRLEAALQRLSVPCEARYYDGETHAFHAFLWRKAARRCWRDMHGFIDDVLASKQPADTDA